MLANIVVSHHLMTTSVPHHPPTHPLHHSPSPVNNYIPGRTLRMFQMTCLHSLICLYIHISLFDTLCTPWPNTFPSHTLLYRSLHLHHTYSPAVRLTPIYLRYFHFFQLDLPPDASTLSTMSLQKSAQIAPDCGNQYMPSNQAHWQIH